MPSFSLLSNRTVTLDITSTAIRLLATSGKRVERWASAPLEAGLIENGLITDPPAVGARVKRLMISSGIKSSRVIASVPGLYSVFRLFQLPEAAAGRTRDTVPQAARDQMPVSEEELYLTWQALDEDERERRGFVVGLPRNIVDAEVQALRSVGITPYILNLKGMALLKLVEEPQALIVNLENDSFDVVLIARGIPQAIRTVALPRGADLEEMMERVARALWQTDSFFESRHFRGALDFAPPLFLAGQMAEDPDVVDMVQSRTHYSVAPLTVPLEHPRNLPLSQYAVNIGLAIRHMPAPVVEDLGELTPEQEEQEED